MACECGCGDDHPDNLYLMTRAAHTALHNRIRRLGIEDHFIQWFSQSEREQTLTT